MLLVLGLPTLVGLLLYRSDRATVLLPLLKATVVRGFTDILPVVMATNSLGYAAALSLILTTCVILWPRSGNALGDGLDRLSTKAKQLKVALYVGTFLLVVSVLLMRSLFQWVPTFVSQPGDTDWKIIEGFNTTVVSVEGGSTP